MTEWQIVISSDRCPHVWTDARDHKCCSHIDNLKQFCDRKKCPLGHELAKIINDEIDHVMSSGSVPSDREIRESESAAYDRGYDEAMRGH